MGEMGEMYRDCDEHKKKRKERLGMPCPDCTVKLPKAQPKILIPNQRCWCGYKDTRKKENNNE